MQIGFFGASLLLIHLYCCLRSFYLYSTDIDVLSWDYGMTDGRNVCSNVLYLFRLTSLNRMFDCRRSLVVHLLLLLIQSPAYRIPFHKYAAMEMYFRHAGMNPNRPACVGLQLGRSKARIDQMKSLEQIGLTTLYMPETVYASVIDMLPNSAMKAEQQVMEEMAPFVRYIKCDKSVENGGSCGLSKYSLDHCPNRKFKTSWHPGWCVLPSLRALFV